MGAWKPATTWVTLEELKKAVADKLGLVDDADVVAHVVALLRAYALRVKEHANIVCFLINLDSKDLLEPRMG